MNRHMSPDRPEGNEAPEASVLLSLIANVVAPLVAVSAVNVLIVAAGWNDDSRMPDGPTTPDLPGWFVGAIWTCLFLMMGAARWRIAKVSSDSAQEARAWIIGLMVFCCFYPIYTMGLSNRVLGLLGNAATAAVALVVSRKLWAVSRIAVFAPAAVVAWLVIASFTIIEQAHGF